MLYSVQTKAGERVMYVPPHIRTRLQEEGIAAGEPFRIGKFEVKTGNRKTVQWKVERVPPEEETYMDVAPPAQVPPPASSNVKNAQTLQHPQNTVPAPRPAPSVAPPVPPAVNGKGTGSKPPEPQTQVPFAGRPDGQLILSALVNMVDICAAVEQYARAKQFDLHFSSEDVRALTITCYIQQARTNGNGNGGAR